MADHVESDTCVGSEREVADMDEALPQHPQGPSGSLSGDNTQKGPKESAFTVSSLGEDEVISFFTESKRQELGLSGNQGKASLSDLASGSVIYESRASLMVKEIKGEISLEAKKKQLLSELEVGSFFKGPAQSCSERVSNDVDTNTEIFGTLKDVDESVSSSLEIQVIDDTAAIEPVSAPKTGNFSVKITEKNGKNNEKQGTEGKKAKQPRKKRKDMKMVQATSGRPKKMIQIGEAPNDGQKNEVQMKRKYSKEQMEDMRFVNIVEQRKLWRDIYTSLGDAVAEDYDDLASSKHQKNYNDLGSSKHQKNDNDPRQCFGRKENGFGILDKDADPTSEGDCLEGECSEEDDSDEDCASIQRLAFHVEGEPDFDSGPPEDGIEYLRRVRWEAAQFPKITVAKHDRSKVNKVQTVYMPQIPDIAKCPEHLMPSKEWEDAFLADFSELRLLLSHDEGSDTKTSQKLKSMSIVQEGSSSSPGNLCNYPTLSEILAMDSVVRVSTLKKHISLAETANTLSKNDCVWLFALCAAVDTPLHADTCAALRSLLRKCASLRAEKSELNDEVVMLNILVTISGRYFRQSES